ncbi:hypothetical protein A2U01_0036950, partial [Trifolium medium]|nr:hypothetical protein [Trifolium medium]
YPFSTVSADNNYHQNNPYLTGGTI